MLNRKTQSLTKRIAEKQNALRNTLPKNTILDETHCRETTTLVINKIIYKTPNVLGTSPYSLMNPAHMYQLQLLKHEVDLSRLTYLACGLTYLAYAK